MMSVDKCPSTAQGVVDERKRLESAENGWGDEGRPGDELHPEWWLANEFGNERRARWVEALRRIRGDSDGASGASVQPGCGSKL